jgi:hypothetical protein
LASFGALLCWLWVRSSQAFSSTDFEVTVDVCGGAYVPISVVVALKWCTNYLCYIY